MSWPSSHLVFQCVLSIAVLFGAFFTLQFYFWGLVVLCKYVFPLRIAQKGS